METPTNRELKIMHDNLVEGIKEIRDTVKTGFDGTHTRLDTANGRTAKNEGFINSVKGGLQVFVFMFGIISTILGFLVGNLYTKIDKLDELDENSIAEIVEKRLSEKYEINIE